MPAAYLVDEHSLSYAPQAEQTDMAANPLRQTREDHVEFSELIRTVDKEWVRSWGRPGHGLLL